MDWLPVIVNLILTGILLYVFQKTIDERSARRLEQFKAELQLKAFEKETKFSKLHEIHSVVIAELYEKLINVRKELNFLKLFLADPDFYIGSAVDVKLSTAFTAEEEFVDYFQSNRLYIPERICVQIDALYAQFSETIKFFSNIAFNLRMAEISKEEALEYLEENKRMLAEALNLSEKIDPLLKQLESDFRKLLGS